MTSSSDAKLARAHALGADVTINYRTVPDLAAAVRAGVGGGVDVVVDVVGKDQLDLNLSLLNEGGLVAAIGMLAAHFSWGVGQFDDKRLGRISVGNREEHEAMLAFCARHAVRPVVDVVYDLWRIQDAMRHLESGAFFGKVGVNLL
jgi:NADPH:quinone reductase-like Zn-dependent oxidoreductase